MLAQPKTNQAIEKQNEKAMEAKYYANVSLSSVEIKSVGNEFKIDGFKAKVVCLAKEDYENGKKYMYIDQHGYDTALFSLDLAKKMMVSDYLETL